MVINQKTSQYTKKNIHFQLKCFLYKILRSVKKLQNLQYNDISDAQSIKEYIIYLVYFVFLSVIYHGVPRKKKIKM